MGGVDDATGVAWAAVGGALHAWRTEPGPAPSGHAAVALPVGGDAGGRFGAAPDDAPPLVAAVPHAQGGGVTLVAALRGACGVAAWHDAAAPGAQQQRPPPLLRLPAPPTALIAAPGVSGCATCAAFALRSCAALLRIRKKRTCKGFSAAEPHAAPR